MATPIQPDPPPTWDEIVTRPPPVHVRFSHANPPPGTYPPSPNASSPAWPPAYSDTPVTSQFSHSASPPPAPGGAQPVFQARWPTALSTSVLPGVRHYRASGALGALTGQAWNLLNSPSFYDFIESVRRFADAAQGGSANHEPISFFLGATPCILVQDDVDLRSVFQTDKMTQGTTAGVRSAPLGLLEALVGKRFNVILLNPFNDDGQPDAASYWQARSFFVPYTHDRNKLNAFFSQAMPGILEQHLDRCAESGTGIELSKLLLPITLHIGGHQLSALHRHPPSDFYLGNVQVEGLAKEEVQALLEDFLALFGDPKLFFQPWKIKSAMADAQEKMRTFALALLEANYDSVRDEPGFITQLWKAVFPDEPFPPTFAEFKAFRDAGDEHQAKEWERLPMGIGFAQLVSSETTGQAANFLLRELCLRPEWFARLREEADGVELSRPTLSTMDELPHASHFVQETLRLYPPVPVTPWATTQPVKATLQGQAVTIPPGTWLFFDYERGNRSSWANPNEFDPRRWEGGPGMDKFLSGLARDQTGFHTFSGSEASRAPRLCAGLKLAAPELVFMLATLVKHYDIEALGPVSLERHAPSTLAPRQPLEVRLQRR